MTEELLRRANAGDEKARNELLTSHMRWLRGYIAKRLYGAARVEYEIDEVVTLTVERYLARPPRPAISIDHFQAQLLVTAKHTIIDAARSLKARPAVLHLNLDAASSQEEVDSVERAEAYAALDRALADIDPEMVKLLQLHHVDAKTLRHIAWELGLSTSAVRYRLRQVKEHLRRRIPWYIILLFGLLALAVTAWLVARRTADRTLHSIAMDEDRAIARVSRDAQEPLASPPLTGLTPSGHEDPGLQAGRTAKRAALLERARTLPTPSSLVYGAVVDEHARHVADAVITLECRSRGSYVLRTVTDRSGLFFFKEVPCDGALTLLVERPGLSLGLVELVAPGPDPIYVVLEKEHFIELDIRDHGDRPFNQLTVQIYGPRMVRLARFFDITPMPTWERAFPSLRQRKSDAEGYCRFDGIYPGVFKVVLEHPSNQSLNVELELMSVPELGSVHKLVLRREE